jgi:hypothetical protein
MFDINTNVGKSSKYRGDIRRNRGSLGTEGEKSRTILERIALWLLKGASKKETNVLGTSNCGRTGHLTVLLAKFREPFERLSSNLDLLHRNELQCPLSSL